MRFLIVASALVVVVVPLSAQTPVGDIAAAAAMITPARLAEHVRRLASDSLHGRPISSTSIERVAQYVAMQFQAMHLRPGIERHRSRRLVDTLWFQRYPVPRWMVQLDPAGSRLNFVYELQQAGRSVVTEEGSQIRREVSVPFTAARMVIRRVPGQPRTWWDTESAPEVVLLTGRPTTAFLQKAALGRKVVLYLPPADLDTAGQRAVLESLYATSIGAVLLAPGDSAEFVPEPDANQERPLRLIDRYLQEEDRRRWAVAVPTAVLGSFLATLRVDVAAARAASLPAVRPVPGLAAWPSWEFVGDTAFATRPNVAGWIEGSDARRKGHCVVVTAPLDPWVSLRRRGDTVPQRAGGSPANLIGLLALAQAFQTLAVRTPYSIIFLATSGSAPGETFWGSQYYVSKSFGERSCRQPVVNLTLDLRVGGSAGDTVVMMGLSDLDFSVPPAWIVRLYPELGLTVTDGGAVVQEPSDAAVFARRGIPSLLLRGNIGTNGEPEPASSGTVEDLERLPSM